MMDYLPFPEQVQQTVRQYCVDEGAFVWVAEGVLPKKAIL